MTQPKVDNKWVETLFHVIDLYGENDQQPPLPNGWTKEGLKKAITQTQQETLEMVIKEATDYMETSDSRKLINYWYNIIVWLQTIKKKMEERK